MRKKVRVGGAQACAAALALALACAVPSGAARAEYLPEGTGTFDVTTVTEVLPVIDPDARLSDVVIHVANDAGEHLEAAQVEVAVVPPNAKDFDARDAVGGGPQVQADAGEEARSHAVAATGTTSGGGRVLLPEAAVGATYRVSVVKDGHEDFEQEFSCAGSDGEVWEVVLNRIPQPLPPGTGSGSSSGGTAALSEAAAATSAASASGQIAASSEDGFDIFPRPVRGFVMLLDAAFPYWLIGLLLAALTAGCLWQARRVRKEGDAHGA